MKFQVGQKIWNKSLNHGAPAGLYEVSDGHYINTPYGDILQGKIIIPVGEDYHGWPRGQALMLVAENCEDNFIHIAREAKERAIGGSE